MPPWMPQAADSEGRPGLRTRLPATPIPMGHINQLDPPADRSEPAAHVGRTPPGMGTFKLDG